MPSSLRTLLAVPLALALLLTASSAVAVGTVVVDASAVGTTFFPQGTLAGGSYDFVVGPTTPPCGAGSLHLQTSAAVAGQSETLAELVTDDHNGVLLSDIDALAYWAYRDSLSTNAASQVLRLILDVDYVGDGTSSVILYFDPLFNQGQQVLLTDTWQRWDAYDGGNATWRATKAIPGVSLAHNAFVPWWRIASSNPNARIRLGVGLRAGPSWPGLFLGYADGLDVGVAGTTTSYDFEPGFPTHGRLADTHLSVAGLMPSGDAKDDQKLDKALMRLEKALDEDLWADSDHLGDDGVEVFEAIKQALRELAKVDGADVEALRADLVAIALAAATAELEAAVEAGGDATEIALATDKLAQAEAETDAEKAVERAKQAWQAAHRAW